MKINEDEITKFSNEELVSKIKDLNKSQMSTIGSMAYVEVYNRVLYLRSILKEDSELIENIKNEEESLKSILDELEDEVLNLNSIKNIKKNYSLNRSDLIEKRKKIAQILRAITAYTTEISFINEIAKRESYKGFLRENMTDIARNMDYDKLFKNVQMFLAEDAKSIKNKVKDIVSTLPVRVSKDKYYDMISNGLKTTLKEGSVEMIDTIISRYKEVYSGTFEKDYGISFDRYFRKAQEYKDIDFKDKTDNEMTEIYNSTFETLGEINRVSAVIREYGIILNRLIAVDMLKEDIIESMEKNQINNILVDWNNYILNPEKNKTTLIETYKKLFTKLDDSFTENNHLLQKLTMENFSRKNKVEEGLKNELETTQYVLSYINDYTIEKEEIELPQYYKAADKEYLDQAVANLIETIDRKSKELSNIQRKARMRRLLFFVDNVFLTPTDFFEYFANSINLTSSDEELAMIANEILEIMNHYRKNGTGNMLMN